MAMSSADRVITTQDSEVTFTGFEALLSQLESHGRAVAKEESERWSDQVELWMKENAPWNDVSGNARGSLGVVRKYGVEFELILTGGVVYMFFLETRKAGRNPILAPALDLWAQVLMDRLGLERE